MMNQKVFINYFYLWMYIYLSIYLCMYIYLSIYLSLVVLIDNVYRFYVDNKYLYISKQNVSHQVSYHILYY